MSKSFGKALTTKSETNTKYYSPHSQSTLKQTINKEIPYATAGKITV